MNEENTPEHDETGTELARRIAHNVRGVRPVRRRRRPTAPQSDDRRTDRDPQLLGAALDRLVTHQGWRTRTDLTLLLSRWPQLVGEVNAEHSTPETFDDGVLTIRADSTAWATSLRTMTPQILAMLNDQLGSTVVDEIRILGPVAPARRSGPRRVGGRRTRPDS